MSLKTNFINAFDFGVNKYVKLINKVTHGYNIKVVNQKTQIYSMQFFSKDSTHWRLPI